MSAEDRESKFERALAQQLRAGSPHAGCPDAERLAAYHERLLSLDEMVFWKQHIAGCAACQETLALVEQSEKQLAEDWAEQPIPVIEAATGTVAKSNSSAVAAPAVAITPVSATPKRRPALLRWAIPLGAVAAGVLVWIGVHEQKALHSARPPESVQEAKNLPQAAPSAGSQGAAPGSAVLAERDREASRLDSQLAQNAAAPPILPKAKSQMEQRTGDFVAGEKMKKDTVLAKKIPALPTPTATGTGGAVAGALPAAPLPPVPAPSPKQEAPRTVTETVEVTSEAPPVISTEKQPVDLPGRQGSGNAVQDQKRVAAMSNPKSAQQYSDAATDALMASQGMNGRVDNPLQEANGTAVIRTPDNKVWWKLGNTGTVELTTDAGKKWKTMDTSASAQLTSGSAPSSKVCWIAGHAGTLLLTTDRGNHWTKLATPVTGDLGGVHAADAKHATVWDTTNRLSYQTSDGGVTWKQTANE